MDSPGWTLRIARPADAAAVSAVLGDACPAVMAPAYDAEVLSAILPAMTKANPALLASGTMSNGGRCPTTIMTRTLAALSG